MIWLRATREMALSWVIDDGVPKRAVEALCSVRVAAGLGRRWLGDIARKGN